LRDPSDKLDFAGARQTLAFREEMLDVLEE
jgi:hypothetical protein